MSNSPSFEEKDYLPTSTINKNEQPVAEPKIEKKNKGYHEEKQSYPQQYY
jgi:hypothetical protein